MKWMLALVVAAACTGPAGKDGPEGPPGMGLPDGGLAPSTAPGALSFVDRDPRPSVIEGTVTVAHATDESAITSYALYWGSSATTKLYLSPIVVLAKTGSDPSFPFPPQTPVPMDATHLLAFARNDNGEFATPSALATFDNHPIVIDASAGAPAGLYSNPTANMIDPISGKLVTLWRLGGGANNSIVSFCSSDGTGCQFVNLGADARQLAIDPVRQKLIMPRGSTQLMFCADDATGCSTIDVIASAVTYSVLGPPIVDATNQRLLTTSIATGTFGVVRSALDGTGMTFVQLMPTTGLTFANAVTTIKGGKLVVVSSWNDNTTGAFLTRMFRCDLDVTNCSQRFSDIPDLFLVRHNADGARLKIVGYYDTFTGSVETRTGVLYDCDLTLTAACTTLDPADGKAWLATGVAHDSVHDRLVLSVAEQKILQLEECSTAGTGCTDIPLGTGGVAGSTMVANGVAMVAQANPATGLPAFVSIRLW